MRDDPDKAGKPHAARNSTTALVNASKIKAGRPLRATPGKASGKTKRVSASESAPVVKRGVTAPPLPNTLRPMSEKLGSMPPPTVALQAAESLAAPGGANLDTLADGLSIHAPAVDSASAAKRAVTGSLKVEVELPAQAHLVRALIGIIASNARAGTFTEAQALALINSFYQD